MKKKTLGFKMIDPKKGYSVDLSHLANFRLNVISDVHIGAQGCDIIKLNKAIEKIKKDPLGYVILNGDNIEFIPPAYKISERGQELANDDQVIKFTELFRPIAHKILFIRGGNHDTERSINIAGCDIVKVIADRLDVPYYELPGHMTIKLKHRNIVIVSGHGFSGGDNGDRELLKMKRVYPDGDVYVLGHNHQLYAKRDDSLHLAKDGSESYHEAWIGRSGSFLEYADYARKRFMAPQPTGHLIVEVIKTQISCRTES